MSFLSRFRRAVDASAGVLGANGFRAGGEVVVCPVCGGREFVRSTGGYVKPPFLKASLPWLSLNIYATNLLCTHCTHVLTFGRAPEQIEGEE
jgi:hypothetical protein